MKKLLIFMSLIMILVVSACTTDIIEPPIETENDPTIVVPDPTIVVPDPTIVVPDPTIVVPDPTIIDEALFIETRLGQLTLAEKVGQMLQAEKNFITAEEVKAYNIGSILSGGGSFPSSFNDGPDVWYNMVKTFQESALESTSGIPLLFGIDAVHGHNNAYGATIFPHNINLGMTRNAELMRQIGIATAKEVKSTGIHWNFSPAVSVTDDIRWGRTYESFSEDASIHQMFIKAYIEGLQSYDVIATAKHFIADGGTFNGVDQGDVILSEAEIRERHLPPYIDAIEAGVESIMISFSSINGLKMHGSKYWITDVLKDELGFEGIILSDWNATFQLPGNFRSQLSSAINAGIDMLMLPMDWKNAHQEIIFAVNAGDIELSRIDDAVTRILKAKYRNNLFEDPFDRLDPVLNYGTLEHQLLARQAASESFVLLKNNDVFPLSNTNNVYIVGPASDHVGYLSGGWTTNWQGNNNADIGTGKSIKAALIEHLASSLGTVTQSRASADIVIVVFTEIPYAEGFGDTMNPSIFGEKSHPANQQAYQEAVLAKAEGKTVIGVLASGRPLLLDNTLDTFDAFIAIFLPGSEGGPALVDNMYGITPFKGKLSFTWPASLAFFTTGKNETTTLFPFGYGLTVEEESA